MPRRRATRRRLEPPVPERERRQDEDVEDGRGDEAAEDHDRHRSLDLTTGLAAADGDRQEAEAGDQRGREDRYQALGRAAQRRLAPPRHALGGDEVLEVGDHHDRVAHRDAEQRDEPHERADRKPSARHEHREHAADQREGQVRQDEQEVAHVAEHETQEQHDTDPGDHRVEQDLPLGPRSRLGHPREHGIDARG